MSLLRDLKSLLQELLIQQRTLRGLENENVRFRQDLIRTQAELDRLR